MAQSWRGAAAVAVAIMLAEAAPAAATVLVATWTGTVDVELYYDLGDSSVFGAPDTLIGATVVSRYTYNTNVGAFYNGLASGFGEDVGGGAMLGNATPLTATVTINHHSLFDTANQEGYEVTSPTVAGEPGKSFIQSVASQDDGTTFDFLYNLQENGPVEPTLTTPLPFASLVDVPDTVGEIVYGSPATDSTFTLYWTIDSLQITGVPEPAAWAMLLVGFGMLGGVSRRRRRAAARL
jgi:hypothetical protein